MNISVYDTSISDSNLGNQIIMDAVVKELDDLFPNDYIFKIPYMEITAHTLSIINSCKYSFFGGTNSLNGNLEEYTQMGINKHNYKKIHNFVSLGMGWWQYQESTSRFSQKLLKGLLCNGLMHSVRDEYTKMKLNEIGISNVINTGCPTLWRLKESGYPKQKSDSVVFTITDYNKNPARDKALFEMISRLYMTKFCFIQGANDYDYLEKNGMSDGVTFIPPRISEYDDFLESHDVDYIGTRLHAGIRALQHKKKTLILGIDNRSLEMKKNFNLPVMPQTEIQKIPDYLDHSINLTIPHQEIEIWKNYYYTSLTR